MNTKLTATLLALAAIGAGSPVYAEGEKISKLDRQELRELRQLGDRDAFWARAEELGIKRQKPQLTEEQKEIIKDLRFTDNKDAIKEQLESWGIEKTKRKGLKKESAFDNLSDAQKEEVKELRESGADKEVVREKLSEFGVDLPERPEISDEQKEKIKELKEAGDRTQLKEYFQEIGLTKKRSKIQKRKNFVGSLSADEKDVLREAHAVARAGDKEAAREMIKEIFELKKSSESSERGIKKFFKRIF